ncbi:hypothetical protein [Clostridium massiliamazoniense]|uniref:hypothetical protein n=1 Tax=Clostridium massiliamazoniense TaxID=1347366 RepID=UPI0006D81C59|nr:hypothetical protein [Clostridium massiliamazoniense]
MNTIKNIIAKKTIKFKVLESVENKLVIKIESVFKGKEEISSYNYLLDRIPNIVPGINSVSLDYNNLIGTITYDNKKINEEKILKILEISKKAIIDDFDYIEENYESNLDEVIDLMEKKLKQKINEL